MNTDKHICFSIIYSGSHLPEDSHKGFQVSLLDVSDPENIKTVFINGSNSAPESPWEYKFVMNSADIKFGNTHRVKVHVRKNADAAFSIEQDVKLLNDTSQAQTIALKLSSASA